MYRIIAPLILLFATAAFAQTLPSTVKLTVTTQPMGQTNKESAARFQAIISYDHQRVALFIHDGKRVNLMLNGQLIATHDWVVPGAAGFTKDSKKLIYVAQDGPEMFVVFDGKPRKSYYEVLPPVKAANDGSHLMYVARPKDGKPRVVIDDVDGAPFDTISQLQMNEACTRVAYVGRRNGVTYFVDGTTETRVDISPIDPVATYMGPNMAMFVYRGRDRKLYARINTQVVGPFEDMVGTPVVTPDGAGWAATVKQDGRWSIVENGKQLATADSISAPGYLKDPVRLMYTSRTGENETLMIGGKPAVSEPADVGFKKYLTFSPDHQRYAYLSGRGKKHQYVVVDGKPGPHFLRVLRVVFSYDSRHVAYFASETDKDLLVMVDDAAVASIPGTTIVGPESLCFTPDGKHVVYLAGEKHGEMSLYVDGVRGPEIPTPLNGSLIAFDDDTTVRLLTSDREFRITAYLIKIEAN